MRRKQQREVVYVERAGDSSAKWLFWGALFGAGVALLYAPSSGEETRRNLQRTLWKFRAMTEEEFLIGSHSSKLSNSSQNHKSVCDIFAFFDA